MQLPIFEKYIDELIEKSTLDVPAWNIEKAREGKAAGWNYSASVAQKGRGCGEVARTS